MEKPVEVHVGMMEELVEVHTGQYVYPIAEKCDSDTIVAWCMGCEVEFGVDDLQTVDGMSLRRAVADV